MAATSGPNTPALTPILGHCAMLLVMLTRVLNYPCAQLFPIDRVTNNWRG